MNTLTELKLICERGRMTLVQDAVGVLALGVMLFVALHLPSLS